jgi:hypothetical protein
MSGLDAAIRATRLYSDGARYVYLKLPAQALAGALQMLGEQPAPFCTVIADRDEVTVVITEAALNSLEGGLSEVEISEPRFRLITFVAVFDFTVVGFMARVSGALAAANVPLYPFAAYSTDHVLVPEVHFETAMRVLHEMGMEN